MQSQSAVEHLGVWFGGTLGYKGSFSGLGFRYCKGSLKGYYKGTITVPLKGSIRV